MRQKYIVWFDEVDKGDVDLVGGKGANLGEMRKLGFPVPAGFIVTSYAYYDFISEAKLRDKIQNLLKKIDYQNTDSLNKIAKEIQRLILNSQVPKEIGKTIIKYYLELPNREEFYRKGRQTISGYIKSLISQPYVAVRSSATAEDLPTASFAGQQATFLNIKGETNVIEAVKKCWASLFEARAIFYRQENKFNHFKVGIAVPVQRMVQSDASGVTFSINPVTSNKKVIIIEAIFGLGELIVQGSITPDHYEVNKDLLKIIKKQINNQDIKLIKKGEVNYEVKVPKKLGNNQKIKDNQIIELAKFAKQLEKHYYYPQDIEWAIEKGKIYIVQTRPVTTISKVDDIIDRQKVQTIKQKVLTEGQGASPGIKYGPVKIIYSVKELKKIKKGDILVTIMTNPDFVPVMKIVAGIITERGGRTSHAAIVSRELGIPCIVGVEKATKIFKDGQIVTVDGSKGLIYKGALDMRPKKLDPSQNYKNLDHVKTATKIYVNLANPDMAFGVAKHNVDGIGLLRAEFMIAKIGVHPKKFIQDKKEKQFVHKLVNYLSIFCKAFESKPIVYRTTDFRTNEYRGLKSGVDFEPREENPFIGFRGALRYITDPQVFEMEVAAIKEVRNKYNYKNLHIMIPFVRTVKELIEVKKILASMHLLRSPSFKLWIMVEIPSNVILIEDFIKVGIDGISIGSNDLTMLTLGIDRDNEHVASSFNETDEAVLWAIEHVIKACHKYKITSSICGQAPSDYPDLVEKLVKWGITSISVNIDAINRVRQIVYQAETTLTNQKHDKK